MLTEKNQKKFLFFPPNFLVGISCKEAAAIGGDISNVGLIPGFGRSPGGENGNPLQYLGGESHGQKSLVGYSPWCRQEMDTTEHVHLYKDFYPSRTF